MTEFNRRTFLATTSSAAAIAIGSRVCPVANAAVDEARRKGRDLVGLYGLTTGSFMKHYSPTPAPGKIVLLDLPKIMRDELDLKVLDLMTRCFASLDDSYCDKLRNEAEKAGRIITNLKMNLEGVDIGSGDETEQRRSLDEYKKTIDIAARLGCRWVRPASTSVKPEFSKLIDGLRELRDYAEPKGISILVENNGWMSREPDALPRIIAALDGTVDAQPDTGNWKDDVRLAGIEQSFPLAVTCDFKAMQFADDGGHPQYDLRQCFDTAWKAGFRGPWCFEHFNETVPGLLRGFVKLRELLTAWTAENQRRGG
jgi:hypothetical protein